MRKVVRFLKEVRAEMAKVIWPTRRRTARLTMMVIIVTVAVAGFLAAVDYGLGQGIESIIEATDKKTEGGNQVPFGGQQGGSEAAPAQPGQGEAVPVVPGVPTQ